MSQDIADRNGRLAQALVLAQLLLAFGGMIVFIFAPREGEPVTLLPLSEDAARTLPSTISAPGSLMLGRGVIERSFVVRGKRPGFLESLFEHGVLVLNASAPGCGPAPAGGAR